MIRYGVHAADRGAAIVGVRHDAEDLLAIAIERLPFSLTAVAERIAAIRSDAPDARFAIDAEGLGSALWAVVADPSDEVRWTLYTGRGTERQSLVDGLLVAVHQGRFHFAAGLAEQEPMSKALAAYRRQVREDGIVGSELVVALLLALMPDRQPDRSIYEDRGLLRV